MSLSVNHLRYFYAFWNNFIFLLPVYFWFWGPIGHCNCRWLLKFVTLTLVPINHKNWYSVTFCKFIRMSVISISQIQVHVLDIRLFMLSYFKHYSLLGTNTMYSWFQTFAVFWIYYVFFWVFPRRLNYMCRRFQTLYLFHLQRQVVWSATGGENSRGIYLYRKRLTRK